MKRYNGNQKVAPGLYFNLRHLSLVPLEAEGLLGGTPEETWIRVPSLAFLVVGPVLGLAYVIFLPFVGFWMLGRLVLSKLGLAVEDGLAAGARVLGPSWEPARAFLSRHRSRVRPLPKRDRWAEEVARELHDEDGDENGEKRS